MAEMGLTTFHFIDGVPKNRPTQDFGVSQSTIHTVINTTRLCAEGGH